MVTKYLVFSLCDVPLFLIVEKRVYVERVVLPTLMVVVAVSILQAEWRPVLSFAQ
jgi:hypothetical protein